MPYGIPKDKGGDSPENVAKMKKCIEAVSRENSHLDEDQIIAICKSKLGFTVGNPQGGT